MGEEWLGSLIDESRNTTCTTKTFYEVFTSQEQNTKTSLRMKRKSNRVSIGKRGV